MAALNDTFTSTGSKFFEHQEAMAKLRDGRGQPIVTHVMLTDVCQHTCAFCSVQARAGDSLPFEVVTGYLEILLRYGLKAVILSGGGNPILYRNGGLDFNDVVDWVHAQGLEVGLITNGMPLKDYPEYKEKHGRATFCGNRKSWKAVYPDTLDKLAWVRVSMAGLDHDEGEVYVPDVDPGKTTLGFSYVAHDIYKEPADPHHGKVSTRLDLVSGDKDRVPYWSFESRVGELTHKIGSYVARYNPRYVRLLPNCLEPALIPKRVEQLEWMARQIDPEIVFVQNKPPRAPKACYLGYVHPVLNCDGWVYPCDSCVLNEAAGHTFANPWRVCRWDEIAGLYDEPVRSLIADPAKTCPGCVFHKSNELLRGVVDGTADLAVPSGSQEHLNFV